MTIQSKYNRFIQAVIDNVQGNSLPCDEPFDFYYGDLPKMLHVNDSPTLPEPVGLMLRVVMVRAQLTKQMDFSLFFANNELMGNMVITALWALALQVDHNAILDVSLNKILFASDNSFDFVDVANDGFVAGIEVVEVPSYMAV